MDNSFGLIKFLAPQIPSLTNTAFWHTLGLTQTSSKWDLRTTLTVQVLRSLMSSDRKPSPIGKVQATTLKDPGIKGNMWVAKVTVKAPRPEEEGLREAVFKAIEEMKEGEINYVKPGLADTEVEWTGYRPNAAKDEPLPSISEEEKYSKMMAEPCRKGDTTILYFHGGAYYLCDPSTHRALCNKLAKETGGVVCNVRYRLAPQAAFPSQLLDAFMMYLTLLYPPSGSMHAAVPAKHIVLGGDSAGGNLAFALLQLLLQLHRTSKNNKTPTIKFHGKNVEVPLPAGVTANSGWFDISRSMPSLLSNAKYDYLPPPNHEDSHSRFPADHTWPANPPRGDLFCDLTLLDHPLASPLAAETWKGSPPLWLCTGWEMLHDEDAIVASRAASQGVVVRYEEYEAMPHCFGMLMPSAPNGEKCLDSWGAFCRRSVEEPRSVATSGVFVHAKTGREDGMEVGGVTEIGFEQARGLMREAKGRRLAGFEREGKGMPKPSL
ncbi:hypothetical protein B0A50_04647 [Salinomyces thailandicus]|uniref:Alpha/beta hydrolase fold-3 domain-containing protein n=1 Tax=Salinomyces thailandicus TaxID=706561 RepID=A0A4U0TV08_9PEZI|nr:hypothetical protein B0A50_04647 [Salinomyces thailandica]